jgi:hypothetical protein
MLSRGHQGVNPIVIRYRVIDVPEDEKRADDLSLYIARGTYQYGRGAERLESGLDGSAVEISDTVE